MKTPQQEFEQQRAQAIAATPFLPEFIPQGAREWFLKAMEYNSIARLRCHIIVYRNLVTWNENTKFMMVEVSLIIDILRAATPKELGQTLEENLSMLDLIVAPMLTKWNSMAEEIETPIKKKIGKMLEIQKGVPESKKIIKIGQA